MSGIAATFDAAAADYARQLQQGIALSGESAEYFVEGRVGWLERHLRHRAVKHESLSSVTATGARPTVLDFGCGVGNASQVLQTRLNAREVIGLDCSAESLRVAEQRHSSPVFKWTATGADIASNSIDIVCTSGVFHHIEPEMRQAELTRLFSWIKPGGLLALFENNSWNPGTQWVMSRFEFDRDAKCLSPIETQHRLSIAGFVHLQTRSMFCSPRLLGFFSPLEKVLSLAPFGAQYVVLAQRPL